MVGPFLPCTACFLGAAWCASCGRPTPAVWLVLLGLFLTPSGK